MASAPAYSRRFLSTTSAKKLNQPGGNSFYLDNDLLFPDPVQVVCKGVFAAGLKYNLQLRHEETRVFVQCAVVTGYLTGTVTNPGGSIRGRKDGA